METVLDLFSGTSRVGHRLKQSGFHVTSNDHLTYAATLAKCYVEADAAVYRDSTEQLIEEMQSAPEEDGYFTRVFCNEARYFMPHNGRRIDGMRRWLRDSDLDPIQHAILTVSLMEAADRVDSTTGVQMAYLKKWAPRAKNDISLRVPNIIDGPGRALQMDAVDAAKATPVDLAYLDPPYNQHSYMGNYHVWETLARGDEPEVYGIACKRVDCRDYKNPFNSKRFIHERMAETLEAVRAKFMLVSFNNEGHIHHDEMVAMLEDHGSVSVATIDFDRYVGAKIGIYNPKGAKVGAVSHTKNKEYLFLVGEDPEVVAEAIVPSRKPLQQKLVEAAPQAQ